MHRSFRDAGRGFGPQNPGMRIGSMIALLIVIATLYSRASKPETWAWLASESNDSAQVANSKSHPTTTGDKGPAEPARETAAPLKGDPPKSPGMEAMTEAEKKKLA